LCAIALSLVSDTPLAFGRQEPGGSKQQRRHHDELSFTQIDFPDSTLTGAFGINNRGQIVGLFIDSADAVHGFLAQ
jgi:hypothetical protein